MFLRRLSENLKSQNWTAIAIELVILVLGVYLGLQAQEWSNRRQADTTAAEYTERLMADFRSELWVRTMLYEYYDDVAQNNERVLDAIEGRVTMADDALLVAAYRATQYIQWYAKPSTYDELLSTGAVDMIRDKGLREQARLTFGSQLMDRMEREGDEARFRVAFRSVVPLPVQRELGRHCGDRSIFEVGDFSKLSDPLDYPCESGLDQAQIAESLEAIRAIDGLGPMLRFRVAQINTRRSALGFNIANIRKLLEASDAGSVSP